MCRTRSEPPPLPGPPRPEGGREQTCWSPRSQGPCRGSAGLSGPAVGGGVLDRPRAGHTAQGPRGPWARPFHQLPLRSPRSGTRRQIPEKALRVPPEAGASALSAARPRRPRRLPSRGPAPPSGSGVSHLPHHSPSVGAAPPAHPGTLPPSRRVPKAPRGGQDRPAGAVSPLHPPTKADFNNLAFRRAAH